MKQKKVRRLVRQVLDEREAQVHPASVMLRNIEICWSKHTIKVNGREVGPFDPEAQDYVVFPILSGDAVFMPRDMERIA